MQHTRFVPQVVKQCSDVRGELEGFAKNFKLDIKAIWFEILKIQTFIEHRDGMGFKLMDPKELKKLDDEDFYNEDSFRLKQVYDIRIIPRENNWNVALKISPFGDKVSLCLYDDCALLDTEKFYESFIGYIETLLVYEGIFVRRRDTYKDLIIYHIKKHIDEKLKFPYEFKIQESEQYRPQQEAYFDFLPQIEWEIENKKIDNAFYAVNKGDKVIRYFKSKKSRSGRNLYGNFIAATQINLVGESISLNFNSEEIEVVDHDEEILYKSLLDAYVRVKDNEIIFYTQKQFDCVDIANTPPLLGGLKKGLELYIASSDMTKDAINEGVILEASKIEIVGNIGPNVRLHATDLKIDGQTHQDAEIIAVNADIAVHKGNLIAKQAIIKSLEAGFVQAEELQIEKCLGGSILSKEAKIDNIMSNNKITISHKLSIGNIEGNSNIITLSSLAYTKTKDLIDNLVKKRDFLISSAKKVYAKYHKILCMVKKNKELIDRVNASSQSVKKQIMQHKNIIEVYEYHNKMTKELRGLKQELLDYQYFVQNTIEKLTHVDEEILNAQIYCDASWGENTKVVYQREFPKKEIKSINVIRDHKGGYKIDKETKEIVEF
ncbi:MULTISPECIES: hypothetical protein [unclassified Helicobacter]|uniref:hypothetical protein n=1 Tax=unclassified Helicobacter TaxID=2593540 RepID=UPI000CF14F80|nr:MULTISPECIES: hypothetical protein [unclassified Helicobacter]